MTTKFTLNGLVFDVEKQTIEEYLGSYGKIDHYENIKTEDFYNELVSHAKAQGRKELQAELKRLLNIKERN